MSVDASSILSWPLFGATLWGSDGLLERAAAMVNASTPDGGNAGASPTTYVHCVDPPFPFTASSAEYASQQPEWRFKQFHGGHNAIVTHPEEMSALLLAECLV